MIIIPAAGNNTLELFFGGFLSDSKLPLAVRMYIWVCVKRDVDVVRAEHGPEVNGTGHHE
jgi:hypothetical protein